MNYDKEKYKIWKLPHPLLLHWIINPGLAINELLLGQRLPKISLIDKTSTKSLIERTYIPCSSCNSLNDSRLWSQKNAFGHWFGYVCPECGARIKCLWNITSLIILVATFPIWIWIKILFEEKWLEKEKNRLTKITLEDFPTAKSTNWVKMGLTFGLLMFITMNILQIIDSSFNLKNILIQFIIWTVAGLIFGFTMKLIIGRRRR